MNEHDLGPLPSDIQQLLATEAKRTTLSAAAVARVTQRIDESVAWAAASAAAPSASPSPAAAAPAGKLAAVKLLSMFAAGAIAGGAVDHLVFRGPPQVEALPAVVVAPPVAQPEPEPAPAAEVALAPPPAEPKRPVVKPTVKAATAAERDRLLAQERALLELARTALSRGKLDDARRALTEHQTAFSNGTLVEEREALAIQALWLEGKPDQARERAAQFRARFPNSVLSPGLEPALSP
ncbi:MAG: hypothetical protein IPJ65_37395 [Archangiaceae bacterium]|nr:hypothetical protein [Archangiaceae bacterium]